MEDFPYLSTHRLFALLDAEDTAPNQPKVYLKGHKIYRYWVMASVPNKFHARSQPVLSAVSSAIQVARRRLKLRRPLRVVVALSGGEDSRVLLHALSLLAHTEGVELLVAHLNHNLRAESAAEAQFAEKIAADYQLPFRVLHAPERPLRENLEGWAREVRYAFLYQVLESWPGDLIATAHHADDLAETLLFRVLTGRLGTSAHTISTLDLERRLFRPLITVEKGSVADFSKLHQLEFVVDESNFDTQRTRNRIRHDLIPKLKEDYNPSLTETLAEVASRLSEDEEYLRMEVMSAFDSLTDIGEPGAVSFKEVTAQPQAILWRVLQEFVEQTFGPDTGKVGYHAWKRLMNTLTRFEGGVSTIELGFGLRVEITKETLQFSYNGSNRR